MTSCAGVSEKESDETAFIRGFYEKYLSAQAKLFEVGESKDDARKALDDVLQQNLTDGMRDYYARYYAVDSLGEMSWDCGDLFTQVQDGGGMDVSSMHIEKKEDGWYTMTHVWRHNGNFTGGTCVLLKLAGADGALRIDTVVSPCSHLVGTGRCGIRTNV